MSKRDKRTIDEIREERRIKHKRIRPLRDKERDRLRINHYLDWLEDGFDKLSREFDEDAWAEYWACYGIHYHLLKCLVKACDSCEAVIYAAEGYKPIQSMKEWKLLLSALRTVRQTGGAVLKKLIYKWVERLYNDYADLTFLSEDIMAERGRVSLTEGKDAWEQKRSKLADVVIDKIKQAGKYPFLKQYFKHRKGGRS